jgi:3-phosphoshikimate 1-carboxyvinyltransferase
LPIPSAQVKSAIILAALNIPGITEIIETARTRDHTEKMLRYIGAEITSEQTEEGWKIAINGQPTLKPTKFNVPADPSSAAFLIAAALITEGSKIKITNVCMNPLRIGLFETLLEMGAKIKYSNKHIECGEDVADIEVEYSKLKGVNVPAVRAPSMIDEYPILSVVASFAEGDTVMNGLKELRVKESNRLQAIADGLTVNGVKCQIDGDNLRVSGGNVRGGGVVKTHMDHRIAMSFLIMGMASENPVKVDDTGMISTSFPNFVSLIKSIGGNLC